MHIKQIFLKKGRARPFFEQHPWVFSGAIGKLTSNLQNGSMVALHSAEGAFIAWGIYNRQSQIQVRLYSWEQEKPINAELICERIQKAIHCRQVLSDYSLPCGALRLVNSEADFLSGLIIDRYADYAVVQINSLALSLYIKEITNYLAQTGIFKGIYLRVDKDVNNLEGLSLCEEWLWGDPCQEALIIEEHGLQYQVSLMGGQKTGFYLDQKFNRKRSREFFAGKKVLDLFCYTGGFALNAASAGAVKVDAYDVSAPCLKLASENAKRNGYDFIKFYEADLFDALHGHIIKDLYDVIVLDPPKMLKSRNNLVEAISGYARLNEGALKYLNPGGLLITNSCSGLVTREDFIRMLGSVAAKTKKNIQLIETQGPSADHPVSVTCPENEYLKTCYCRVL